MQRFFEDDSWDEPFYLAGQKVPAGRYQDTSSGREVTLDKDGSLPASFDGHVACYHRISCTWQQLHRTPGALSQMGSISDR